MTQVLFGAYEPDSATLGTGKTAYVKNVLPRTDGYGPMPGLSAVGAALPGICVGYKSGFSTNGTPYLIAGTATHLYRLNNTTLAWDDITNIGGPYALQATDFWSFDQFGDTLIAAGGPNVNVQAFTLSTGTRFADLAGSPPRSQYVSIVGDFAVLAGISGHPNRLEWSGINDPTWWTPDPTGHLSDFQDFPDGGNVRGVAGGEYGIVFQDTAIRQMIFAPGSSEIFTFNRISSDRGIAQPLSLTRVQTAAFFLGSDGFYRVDPSSAPAPIGNNRVNATFLADADLTSPLYTIGAADVTASRVMWAYRSRNAARTTRLDKALIYDWALDRWSYAEIGLEFIGSASQPAITLEGLDTISANIDLLPNSLDSYIPNTLPRFSGFSDVHKFGFWTGTNLEAVITTPENTIGNGQRIFIRGISPIGDASTVAGSVLSRERLIDVQRQSNEAVLNVRGYCPLRASGRYHSARVRVPAGASWSYMRGIEADVAKLGGR